MRPYTYPDGKSLYGVYGYKLPVETSKAKNAPRLTIHLLVAFNESKWSSIDYDLNKKAHLTWAYEF